MSDEVPIHTRLRYRFLVYGSEVPMDHGEALYAAISSHNPRLRDTTYGLARLASV